MKFLLIFMIPIYSFPLKNYQLRNRWIESFGLKDFQPNEKSLICDAHFEEHCFYKRKRGGFYLKANAYPTLFSSHLSNGKVNNSTFLKIFKTEIWKYNISLKHYQTYMNFFYMILKLRKEILQVLRLNRIRKMTLQLEEHHNCKKLKNLILKVL